MAETLDALAEAPQQGPPDSPSKRAKFLANFSKLDPDAELDEAGLDDILGDPAKRDEFAKYVGSLNPDFQLTGEELAGELSKKKDSSAPTGSSGPDSSALGSEVAGSPGGDQEFQQVSDAALNQQAEEATGEVGQIMPGRLSAASVNDPAVVQALAGPAPAEAADVADDGFWASLGKSLFNGLDPKRIGGNLLDYFGDMGEMQGRLGAFGGGMYPVSATGPGYAAEAATREELTAPLSDTKPSDVLAADWLARAKEGDMQLSQAAQQSVLQNPSLASAGNLIGSGVASIVPVAAASALAGPGAGAAVGAGLGISSTKDAARAAGISDQEAAITATVLAPIQGALEAIGVKDPGIAKLALRETVREAITATGGKLTAEALSQAARRVVPELGRRALAGALREVPTEGAQALAEGEGQVLADALRDNPEAAKGAGRYGTTQGDVLENMGTSMLAALPLGGGAGLMHGASPTQQAPAAPAPLVAQEQPINDISYTVRRPTGQVEMQNVRVHAVSADGQTAVVRGVDGAGQPVEREVPTADLRELVRSRQAVVNDAGEIQPERIANPRQPSVSTQFAAPTTTEQIAPRRIDEPTPEAVISVEPITPADAVPPLAAPESAGAVEPGPVEAAAIAPTAPAAPQQPAAKLYAPATENDFVEARKAGANPLPALALEITPDPADPTKATFTLNPQANQQQLIGDGLQQYLGNYFDYNQPTGKASGLSPRAEGRLELVDGNWQVTQKGALRVEDGSAEQAPNSPTPLPTTAESNTAPSARGVPTGAEPLSEPATTPEPRPRRVSEPAENTPLTAQQQNTNNALDALDAYNSLNGTQRKSADGKAARKAAIEAGKKAGLTLTDQNGKLGYQGKRLTRANEYTATSPAADHVPLDQRPADARPFIDRVLTNAETIPAALQGLGIKVRGKELSARELAGAVQDIKAGKNTLRAAMVLDALENAHNDGFIEKSEGNGINTRKYRIPTDDYLPGEPMRPTAQPVELNDAELDALITQEPKVRAAIESYTDSSTGEVDYAKLAADAEQGVLDWVYELPEPVANNLKAIARERATDTPAPQAQPGPGIRFGAPAIDEATAFGGSTTEGRAEPTETGGGSPAAQPAEVAAASEVPAAGPAPTPAERVAELADQNRASIDRLKDLGGQLWDALGKQTGKAGSLGGGLHPDVARIIKEMAREAVKLGAGKSKEIIARIRAAHPGLTDDVLTDEQLKPVVQQVREEAGLRQPKQAKGAPLPANEPDGSATRKSMGRLLGDDTQPEALKQRIRDTGLDKYEPKSLAETQQAVDAYMQRNSLADAYAEAISTSDNLTGDVRTALRVRVMQAINGQMREALNRDDQAAADQYLDQSYKVAEALAKRGTDAGREINAYKVLATLSPEAAVYKAQKEVRAQREQKLVQAEGKGKQVAGRARKIQKEAVSATVNSPAVQKAKQALSGDPTATTTKEPTTYGGKNKFFTKNGLKELRAKTSGLLFSAPISPVVLYEGAYHLEAGVRKFADWSAKMIRSYGAAIRPRLAEIYDLSKEEYVKQGGNPNDVQSAADVDDAIAQEQAEMLAQRILQKAKDKPTSGPVNPVQQLLDTLTAKVAEKLPKQTNKKISPREAIIAALRNQAEYADVWERAKDQVSADIDANTKLTQAQKAVLHERLETFYNETIGQPYATRQATQVVREGLKSLNQRLDDIVRRHSTAQDATGRTLVQKLVQEAGLTYPEAQAYADVVENEFKRQIADRQNTILNRIHAKLGAVLPIRAKKTALTRLLETLNLSPITDERVVEILQDQLDLPALTAQDVDELRTLAQAVQDAPDGFQKDGAVEKLLKRQQQIKGIGWADIGQALWYANVLSGYKTHAINFTANIIQTGSELGVSTAQGVIQGSVNAIKNRINFKGRNDRPVGVGARASAPIRGLFNGVARGGREAISVLTTGRETSRSADKFEVPGILENVKTSLGLKYVNRALRAGDVLFSSGLKEMRAYELAVKEALADAETDGTPNERIWERAAEKLYRTKDRIEAARAKADSEGLTGNDRERRVYEIAEQSRNAKMMEQAREYGTRAVFNGEVEGGLGVVATGIQRISEGASWGGFKPAKYIVPFTRVITNVANAYLDYTPIGAARAAKGSTLLGGKADASTQRQYTREERQRLLIKSVIGSSVAVAAYALSNNRDENDEPLLEITGAGTGIPQKDAQLRADGWQQYSVRVRGTDRWVSYANTPIGTMLSVVGNINDGQKYRGEDMADDGALQSAYLNAFRALQFTKDMTALKGAADFLSAVDSRNPGDIGRWVQRLSAGTVKGYVPWSGLLTQVAKDGERLAGENRKQARSFGQMLYQDIPVARNGINDAIDALGDPIKIDTDRLFSDPPHRDEQTQRVWDWLNKNGLFISVPNRNSGGALVVRAHEGKETPMSEDEYYSFMKHRGDNLKAILSGNMAAFERLDGAQARKALDEITTAATELAKAQTFAPGGGK